MKIQTIKVSEIKHGETIRPENSGDMESLAASIAESGQLVPIMVRPVNGHYETVFGNRRLAAAKKAKVKELVAVVADEKMTRAEVLKSALIENLCREDMSPLQKAEAIKAFMKEGGLSERQVAVSLGISQASVNRFVALASEPVAIKRLTAAEPGGFTASPRDIEKTRVPGLSTEDRVALLKAAAKNKLPDDEIPRRAKEIAATKSEKVKQQIINAPPGDKWYTARNLEKQEKVIEKALARRPPAGKKVQDLKPLMADMKTLIATVRHMSTIASKTLYSPESIDFIGRKLDEVIRSINAVKQQISRQKGNAR